MEIFFYYETIFFIELTFAWLTFPLINIDNIPLLMKTVVSLINTDISILLINVAYDFHDFASLVDDIVILESE
jgi:hypothetical protein